MTHARILFFASLLALAACGSDPATCKISDNGDGTRTIACPGADPIRVVDGDADTSCTISTREDGGKEISCSDGTVVRICPDGLICFPGGGNVAGAAQLFGKLDHSGIRVSAVGTEFSTTTDAAGAYRLTLPAGIHVLLFEAPGRVPARVTNVPVINGTWDLDPVVLKIARRVGGDVVTASPSGDAVLVFTRLVDGTGWLELAELTQVDGVFEEDRRLGGVVTQDYAFSGDGRFVLYQERTGIDGALRLWDRVERQEITIAEHALRGHFASRDTAVVYERLDGLGGCELHAWWRENGRVAELGSCLTSGQTWQFNEDGTRFFHADENGAFVLHGVDDGSAHSLGGSSWVEFGEFLTGGRYVLFWMSHIQDGPGWRLLDGETGRDRQLNTSSLVVASPDGGTLLFSRSAGDTDELVAHRIADEIDILLSSGPPTTDWRFSSDGARVLWMGVATPDDGAGVSRTDFVPPLDPEVLHVVELAAPENRAIYASRGVQWATFTGSEGRVFLRDDAGTLVLWDPATGVVDELSPSGQGWLLSPDGTRLAVAQPDGAMLVADFGSPVRRESTGPVEANHIWLWAPDGSGIVYGGWKDEVDFLTYWAPPADPVSMGADAVGVSASPDGTFAVLECYKECAGNLLVLYYPDDGTREPVDDRVSSLRLENGVLIYRVSTPDDETRSGFYAAMLP